MALSLIPETSSLILDCLSINEQFVFSKTCTHWSSLTRDYVRLKSDQSFGLRRLYGIAISKALASDFIALFRRIVIQDQEHKDKLQSVVIECICSSDGKDVKAIHILLQGNKNFSFRLFYKTLETKFVELTPSHFLPDTPNTGNRRRRVRPIPVSPFPEDGLAEEIYKMQFLKSSSENKTGITQALRKEIQNCKIGGICPKELIEHPLLFRPLHQLFQNVSNVVGKLYPEKREIPHSRPISIEVDEKKVTEHYVHLQQPSPVNRRRAYSVRNENQSGARRFFSLPQVQALRLRDEG